ncbi:DUF1127 domain-containing protein [Tropicimonas sp.]|uniref:DUF1127 domain-containing protein n=1 Tax=Tropicimonas sp. TaxID=2067044 RepID=UPI003A86806D
MSIHSTHAAPLFGSWHGGRVVSRIRNMVALRRQRRNLAELDDRALRDIGVSRYEAEIESARPSWDVPQHWRA